jgi:predicted dehydrogenase
MIANAPETMEWMMRDAYVASCRPLSAKVRKSGVAIGSLLLSASNESADTSSPIPKPIRWGILGGGSVARLFAGDLHHVPGADLAAVASQSPSKLREIASLYPRARTYESYSGLVHDPDVDIVYIATTNQLHKDHALLCLEAGKPVLCEKPFAMTAEEARLVVAAARDRRLFCMEAMWTRCLPLMRALRSLLDAGAIGEIRMLRADFGSLPPFSPDNRYFNPALGGGAMLDLGVYLLSLASFVFGPPISVTSKASIGKTGVDEQSAAVLAYERGQLAMLGCSLVNRLPTDALIAGTSGQIRIHAPVHHPRALTLTVFEDDKRIDSRDGAGKRAASTLRRASPSVLTRMMHRLRNRHPGVMEYSYEGRGYHFEAAEAMRCLRAGEIESPLMPLNETVEIMQTLDAVRAGWIHRAGTDA